MLRAGRRERDWLVEVPAHALNEKIVRQRKSQRGNKQTLGTAL